MRRVGGVLLEGEEVALAAVLARLGVAYLQARNGTAPAAALALRDALAASARGTIPAQASGGRGSAEASAAVIVADSPAETTAQAAARLGISARAVRNLCVSGALAAAKDAAGRWRIEAWSAEALARRRKERG